MKLKVLYVFRTPRIGVSIEGLFSIIIDHLPKNIQPSTIYMGGIRSFFTDIVTIYKSDADIVHITGDVHYVSLFVPFKKVVLTVHDINYYEDFMSAYKKPIFWLLWIMLPAIICKKIIVISNTTRMQFLGSIFGLYKKKIVTIYNCVNPEFKDNPKKNISNPPTILHIGTDPNKNLRNVIYALSGMNTQLRVIGKVPLDILNLASSEEVVLSSNFSLSFNEMINEYKIADIVSFPSLSEGFGLPVLEAQKMGRALLTSNIEPIRSIAGPGACLINPNSILEIRDGFNKLISNKCYRDKVIKSGLLNSEEYMPSKTAEEYATIYLSLTDKSG